MLTHLHIRDLAIVDAAEIEFDSGFTWHPITAMPRLE